MYALSSVFLSFLSVFSYAPFLYRHGVLALCLLVLCLRAGDALSAQVLVATDVGVGKSPALLNEDGDTH